MSKTYFKYYDTINNTSYPGHKLKGKEKYLKLYHFTSFDVFTRIWISQELKYGSITNVNDIQESSKYFSIQNLNQLPVMCAFKDILSSYKQISFTMDIDSFIKGYMNTLMWGHYGEKSKGVCIEFDYDKIRFPIDAVIGVVKYTDFPPQYTKLPDMETIKQVKHFVSKNLKKLFFYKQTEWKGENEFRVISSGDDYLSIKEAITSVYLTSCMSKECQLIEKLVNGSVPVKYLDYHKVNNVYLPTTYDTKSSREELLEAQEDSNNALELFYKQAWKHYEKHKYEENKSLLLDRYEISN